MKPANYRLDAKPHGTVARRVVHTLGQPVYRQMDESLLGVGPFFREQLVDFFPDPYADETLD